VYATDGPRPIGRVTKRDPSEPEFPAGVVPASHPPHRHPLQATALFGTSRSPQIWCNDGKGGALGANFHDRGK